MTACNASLPDDRLAELHALAAASLSGEPSDEEIARLERLVCEDPKLCKLYVRYMYISWNLRTWAKYPLSDNAKQQLQPSAQDADVAPLECPADSAPIGLQNPPLLGFLGGAWHGTVGFFSQEVPFGFLMATVICGVMIAILAHTYVSDPPAQKFAHDAPRPVRVPVAPVDSMPAVVSIGSITGMVDCQWSDRFLIPVVHRIILGQKFALASGLIEITYDTGAKVILQGPCTYTVDSTTGGFLSLGKLTARVEKKAEGGGRRAEDVGVPPSAFRLPSSAFRLPPSALFAVRTPTAIVTDLGTEFGVEVNKGGLTESHVYRGKVVLAALGDDGKRRGREVTLGENESARVESSGGGNRVTVLKPSTKTAGFVRKMINPAIKTLDLVDVVAGGDGFSGRRGRGIDPTNGRIVDALRTRGAAMPGDGQYHRVAGMPLVDGVFIPNGGGAFAPDGGKDGVQTDSAGHVFAGFDGTTNTMWQHIWAGGAMRDQVYPSKVCGTDYASPGHGLVLLCANSAITFDLEAIRRANLGSRLLRFRAVVANTGAEAGLQFFADVWVLVDGQWRFQRRLNNNDHGVVSVLVPIGDKDRFLTLAATDAGDGNSMDWIVFGDPRLELLPVNANEQKEKGEHAMNGP